MYDALIDTGSSFHEPVAIAIAIAIAIDGNTVYK
jgi:hypothetical protein